jgi:hypothetical protein
MPKFREIKQMTKSAVYHNTREWHYLLKDIKKYLKEYGLDLNPDFQRGYVWTESQQIAYVEFILRGGRSGLDIYFNHPGWMIDFKGPFVIVDGKQRLNAVMRFLNNEIKVFGYYYKEFEDRLPSNVYFDFYINDLPTRKEVLTWYLEFNSGGTVHTKKELDKVRKLIDLEK